MMDFNRSKYFLCFSLLLLSLLQQSRAVFNEGECNKMAEGTDITQRPFNLYDFSVDIETAIKRGEDETFNRHIVHESLWFSNLYRQAMVIRETANKDDFFYVDELRNGCVYKENGGPCTESLDSCNKITDELDFVSKNKLQVDIGSAENILYWPNENVKRKVYKGKSATRSIKTDLYATCTYDPNTDETGVSLWHVLDIDYYSDLKKGPRILLAALHKQYKDDKLSLDKSIDYTNFKILKSSDIPNGLIVDENQCRATNGTYFDPKVADPSPRFGYIKESGFSDTAKEISPSITTSYFEYNYNTQLLITIREYPTDDANEKELTVHVHDFTANHILSYSLTNGNCLVSLENLIEEKATMETPKEYWHLDSPKKSFLGIFENRNIPCETWLLEYPDGGSNFSPGDTITLYLATKEWLEENQLSDIKFYPVQMITRYANSASFSSFFNFKNNPGYDIPGLTTCYSQADTVIGMVTLLKTNYNELLKYKRGFFEREFRTFIMNITGIISPLRVADIVSLPSKADPQETNVIFKIHGRFTDLNESHTDIYRADPVSSKEAANRINTQVDTGMVKFTLDEHSQTLFLKKKSFAILKNYDHFEGVDAAREGANGRYSSGAMAALGIVLLLVCLAIGTLAVFMYKRWTEGGSITSMFGMQTLTNEK